MARKKPSNRKYDPSYSSGGGGDLDTSYYAPENIILSNMLAIGSCGAYEVGVPVLKDDDEQSGVESIVKNARIIRLKFSLALDQYANALQKFIDFQQRFEDVKVGIIQELEVKAHDLREVSDKLIEAGCNERERLMKSKLNLLKMNKKFGDLAAINSMHARYIIDQHFSLIRFEKKACRLALEIVMNQYDQNELFDEARLIGLHQLAEGVRHRVNLDKIELVKIYDTLSGKVDVSKRIYENTNVNQTNNFIDVGNPASILCNVQHKTAIIKTTCDNFIENIAYTHGVEASVKEFLEKEEKVLNAVSNVLIVGDNGSGKTHLCEVISKMAQLMSVEVVKPSIPCDFCANTVGLAVDHVFSLFAYAAALPYKSIIILDNINKMIDVEKKIDDDISLKSLEPSLKLTLAIRSAFLSCLKSFQHRSDTPGKIMIICTTSRQGDHELEDCFNCIKTITSPNDAQRMQLLKKCLNLSSHSKELDASIERAADFTVGRSVADIAGLCRQTITKLSCDKNFQNLNEYKESDRDLMCMTVFETCLSDSRTTGTSVNSLDGMVDLKVSSSDDLISMYPMMPDGISPVFPLFGSHALQSWKQLESIIIPPLCRYKELDEIIFGRQYKKSHGGKVVCCGALITGLAGTGKSSLARYCAAVAASHVPSMKLLEVSCTSLVHKEVGGSERALKQLFRAARETAPCILLLDGLENIARVRGNDNTSEGTMDRLVSSLLIEMDSVEDGGGNIDCGRIAIIGITSEQRWIDPAVRRPGRLEVCINMCQPDGNTRTAIIRDQVSRMFLDFTESSFFDPKDEKQLVDFVSMRTTGMNAAEVIAICEEAKISRIREIATQMKEKRDKENYEKPPSIRYENFATAIRLRSKGSLT